MKLRNRFLLVGIGVVLFLLITPIVVLFARGFKYDFTTNQIVKTGTLVVRTEPTGADVFMNDEQSFGETPINIRFLLPRDYNVRIEKDEYQSWTKRLSIREQFVTWANEGREFIALFFQQPKQDSEATVTFASISKDRSRIGYISDNELHEINVNNQNDELLRPITSPLNLTEPLIWTRADQLQKLPLGNFQDVDKIEVNDIVLVALANNNLYRIADTGERILLDENVTDFTLDGRSIWYIQNSQILTLDLSTNGVATIAEIPAAVQSQLIRTNNKLYAILDSTLYVINDSLEKIYSETAFAVPDSRSGHMLYGNDNEIWTYNPDSHRSELILRSLTPISLATLNSETGYVLFVNDDKIKAVELDGRDHRNTYTILELGEDFLDFVISENGTWIYVVSSESIKKYQIR